ncbi:hypothetical protein GGI25_000444 [Coemansia spiralis]|uniref:Uncharacterized protein n=2 Tax=Coemansia TaxID=4863 RepID=A0A9W8GEG1_9FUNG|nr:hypothetical protein EDC05_000271 [Coemansia umbellata]KAJ2624156.1 hypothetical protein GGI26_001731 [Coemansia sp. RSA 1358]KAJ2680808.1 hypothetical protein GGI25_000444 [Coemansia spiralis]
MSDTRSSSASPVPMRQHPRTVHIRRASANNDTCRSCLNPSPYSPKTQTMSDRPAFAGSSAGIGGPPKRRESMSGIGNNLRSHNPAGLGRSVGKAQSASPNNAPSGIADLLRRASMGTNAADIINSKNDNYNYKLQPAHLRRRGSVGTAAPITANASSHRTDSTVFPMSHAAVSDSLPPLRPRRCTTIAVQYAEDDTVSPQIRSTNMRQFSFGPADLSPISPLSLPCAGPDIISARAESLPFDTRVVCEPSPTTSDSASHNDEHATGSNTNSLNSSVQVSMTFGSPKTGRVIDVVGSPTRPSVVYAPMHRDSRIGGAGKGKATMQQKSGLGGSFGKHWMADRPSGIGSAVPQNAHPDSGISKALKSLKIRKRKSSSSSDNAEFASSPP